MINPGTKKSAVALYTAIKAAGGTIASKDGTHIDLLVSTAVRPETEASTPDELFDQVVAATETPNAAGVAEFAESFEVLASYNATALMEVVNFTRNVVNPAIRDALSRATDKIKSMRTQRYNVVIWEPASIVYHDSLRSNVEKYDNSSNFVPAGNSPFKMAVTEERLAELIRTGITSFDDQMVDFLSKKPAGYLSEVYNTAFMGIGSDMPLVDGTAEDGRAGLRYLGTAMNVERLMVAYLMTIGMAVAPEEDVPYSLLGYREAMSAYTFALAAALCSSYKQLEGLGKGGRVILSGSSHTPAVPIYVYGPTYRTALEKGITVETIIGAVRSKGYRDLAALLENSAAYASVAMNYTKSIEASDRKKQWDSEVNACCAACAEVARELSVNPQNVSADTPTLLEGINSFFNALQQLPDQERAKYTPFRMCNDALQATVFAGTDSSYIRGVIEKLMLANPELDARSAAERMAFRLLIREQLKSVVVTKD